MATLRCLGSESTNIPSFCMYIHSVSMYVTEIRLFSSSFLSRHHQVSTARTRNSSSDPFLLVTGLLVFIQLLKQRMETVNGSLFSLSVGRWALTTWALSITVQMSATLLIAWRIWSIEYQSRRATDVNGKDGRDGSSLSRVINLIVESGRSLPRFGTPVPLTSMLSRGVLCLFAGSNRLQCGWL